MKNAFRVLLLLGYLLVTSFSLEAQFIDAKPGILNAFNKAKVVILSPHYSAFLDGNASTIPAEFDPEAPAPFRSSKVLNPAGDIVDKVTGKK